MAMSMQDLFAEAVERLVAGEPATSIVQSYPANVQEELSKLLAVVELADHVAVQPMPSRSPMQRQRARSAFLQQAQTMRGEAEQALGAAGLAGAAANGVRPAPRISWSERLRNFFDAPLLRLSPVAPLVPLIAVMVAVALATFWTVQSAKAALPGDPTYPLKQWMRQQSITLASAEQRPAAVRAAEDEIAAEAATIATQRSSRDYLDVEYSEAMIFYGRQGNRLLIGPFQVAPNFQPDPNVEEFVPMLLDGDLEPGARVQLVYRLLPGGTKVVQGVSAAVIEGPQPTPAPTAVPVPENGCQAQLPNDWIPYAVRAGDSLQGLAQRSGTSVAAIQRVNCIDSLGGVGTIYLPERIVVRVTPPAMPSPLPTYTPWPTPTAEPALEPTLAPTLEPTATEPQLTTTPEPPTTQPTGAETPVATEPGATATPVNGTPAGTATSWETPAPGETATPGATAPAGTATPLATPAATTTPATPGATTAAGTATPLATPTATTTPATPTPGATPTDALTAQPTVNTTEPASTPTAQGTTIPTAAPLTATPDATAQPGATTQPDEPAPTSAATATQAREQAATPAPTQAPTEASQPTREPPTPEPPTREPPTREPPTREPPTPEPPPTRAPEPTPVPAQVDPPTPIPPAETSNDGGASAP